MGLANFASAWPLPGSEVARHKALGESLGLRWGSLPVMWAPVGLGIVEEYFFKLGRDRSQEDLVEGYLIIHGRGRDLIYCMG